jgi:hypothetical protein
MNVVECKWVYKMKLKAYGNFERLKARLVSNGFTQLEGIDCAETFSPIVKPQTIHIVLTITLNASFESLEGNEIEWND